MKDIQLQVNLLADCTQFIEPLSALWVQEIGNNWEPTIDASEKAAAFVTHLNRKHLPLTYVAHENEKLVGTASLRVEDGLNRKDLSPWLGSLIVAPNYRKQGIGEYLITCIENHARALNFKQLYLFTFSPKLVTWYESLGWKQKQKEKFNHHEVTIMETLI